jgi:predicted house-cleaning noncanonical NTP pyrophosphatase (MazG superfamily)
MCWVDKLKLVRDYIPEIIEADGKWCLTRKVHGVDEHMVMLKEKIVEESQEFIENPSYEEAADLVEVVKTLCYLNDLEWGDVLRAAVKKQETHGGFYKGIVLQKVGED